MNYKDRNGNVITGNESQDEMLTYLYSKKIFRQMLKACSAPWVSKAAGIFLDSSLSAFIIDPFVKKNNLSLKEYPKKKYRSYNDFFTRSIKKECRPINQNPESLIAPCDGKVSAYKIDEKAVFHMKQSRYTVTSMLRDRELAKEYEGGTCVILRLTVDNYHRYCYVDDAKKGRNIFIPGRLYTVNPVILDHVNIYKENSRAYCVLETKNFDKVIQMEVGALIVGKINNYDRIADVKRGQEKGRFEFGGSTVVLLLKKDAAVIDEDILKNTKDGYETVVKMGERIGAAKHE